MMQKDIVGVSPHSANAHQLPLTSQLLPPELSIRILSVLDADDLLQCKLVNRTWAQLCDDQSMSLWPPTSRHPD